MNGARFPTLQRIARDIFSIPVSTVASESSFNTSGRVIAPHRGSLHEDTVEALMCNQNWLWTAYYKRGYLCLFLSFSICLVVLKLLLYLIFRIVTELEFVEFVVDDELLLNLSKI